MPPTLTQALAAYGITHAPAGDDRWSLSFEGNSIGTVDEVEACGLVIALSEARHAGIAQGLADSQRAFDRAVRRSRDHALGVRDGRSPAKPQTAPQAATVAVFAGVGR